MMMKGTLRCDRFTVLASKRERATEIRSVASLHVRNCCCFPFYPTFVPLFLFLCSTSLFPLFFLSCLSFVPLLLSFVLSFLSFILFGPSFRISFVRSAFCFVPSLSFFLSFFLPFPFVPSFFPVCPFLPSFFCFVWPFLPSFLPSCLFLCMVVLSFFSFPIFPFV